MEHSDRIIQLEEKIRLLESQNDLLKEALEKIYKRMQKLALNAKKEILLTPKQVELIETLQAHGPMGSQKLGLVLNVNRARINQLIRPLIKARIIKTEGQARATRYSLTD